MDTSPFLERTPAQRFALIIELMCRAVIAHGVRSWGVAPLVPILWAYLRRKARRFDRLMARFHAGQLTWPPARSRTEPRAEPESDDAADTRPAPKPRPRLPTTFAWLAYPVAQTRPFGTQLAHLLTDPEMMALLAAGPQAGRLLRPLLRMLGQGPAELGPTLGPLVYPPRAERPTPRRASLGRQKRRSRPAAPAPQTAAPDETAQAGPFPPIFPPAWA